MAYDLEEQEQLAELKGWWRDNGNLVLDNVDRTTRAGKKSPRAALRQVPCPAPPTPPTPPPTPIDPYQALDKPRDARNVGIELPDGRAVMAVELTLRPVAGGGGSVVVAEDEATPSFLLDALVDQFFARIGWLFIPGVGLLLAFTRRNPFMGRHTVVKWSGR